MGVSAWRFTALGVACVLTGWLHRCFACCRPHTHGQRDGVLLQAPGCRQLWHQLQSQHQGPAARGVRHSAGGLPLLPLLPLRPLREATISVVCPGLLALSTPFHTSHTITVAAHAPICWFRQVGLTTFGSHPSSLRPRLLQVEHADSPERARLLWPPLMWSDDPAQLELSGTEFLARLAQQMRRQAQQQGSGSGAAAAAAPSAGLRGPSRAASGASLERSGSAGSSAAAPGPPGGTSGTGSSSGGGSARTWSSQQVGGAAPSAADAAGSWRSSRQEQEPVAAGGAAVGGRTAGSLGGSGARGRGRGGRGRGMSGEAAADGWDGGGWQAAGRGSGRGTSRGGLGGRE